MREFPSYNHVPTGYVFEVQINKIFWQISDNFLSSYQLYIATNSLSCFRLVMCSEHLYEAIVPPSPFPLPSTQLLITTQGKAVDGSVKQLFFFKERTGPERFSFYCQKGEGRVLERRIKESADDTTK